MKKAIIAAVVSTAMLLGSHIICLAQKKPAVDKHGPGEDIYKHYTGTIGNKKVAFDLRWGFQGGSNYGGSSYYTPTDDKVTRLTIGQPRSFDHSAILIASELPPDTSLTGIDSRDRSHTAKLTFTIGSDKLTGKWHNMDVEENYDITLTEDYSNSMPLNVGVFEDTSAQKLPESDNHIAKTNLICIQPKEGTDAKTTKLLNECILSITGLAAKGVKDMAKLRQEYIRYFAAECEKDIKADTNKVPRPGQKMAIIMPVYNDNGLLVLENEESVWRQTGFKGYYHYACLDFRKGHIYKPSEILNIDKEQLSKMLETELRKKYNLDANKPLTAWLKHSVMPVSNNFYPIHKGIVFVYTSDELLDGSKVTVSTFTTQISVCVPYTMLGSMLQKGFKKRVGA